MTNRWIYLAAYGCFVKADDDRITVTLLTHDENDFPVPDLDNAVFIKEPENQPFLDAVNAIFGTGYMMKDFGYDMEHTCVDEDDPNSGDPYPCNGIIKALDPKRQATTVDYSKLDTVIVPIIDTVHIMERAREENLPCDYDTAYNHLVEQLHELKVGNYAV